MGRQADRQTDRETDRQTDRQRDRQTDIHTYIHTDRHENDLLRAIGSVGHLAISITFNCQFHFKTFDSHFNFLLKQETENKK